MIVSTDKLGPATPDAAAQAKESDFEARFREHWPRVYGALFRLVGDRAEAEDLALETFWQLWQRPPARADNLGGWLYRVATRLGYNALRAGRRRERYETAAGQDALERERLGEPEQEVALRQTRRQVREVLRKLPPRDAQLLILRYSGLAYKEIAAALGVAPGSVGTLLARAEAKFQDLYGSGER